MRRRLAIREREGEGAVKGQSLRIHQSTHMIKSIYSCSIGEYIQCMHVQSNPSLLGGQNLNIFSVFIWYDFLRLLFMKYSFETADWLPCLNSASLFSSFFLFKHSVSLDTAFMFCIHWIHTPLSQIRRELAHFNRFIHILAFLLNLKAQTQCATTTLPIQSKCTFYNSISLQSHQFAFEFCFCFISTSSLLLFFICAHHLVCFLASRSLASSIRSSLAFRLHVLFV